MGACTRVAHKCFCIIARQDAAVREHNDRLEVAASAARQLARRQDTGVKERLEAVRSLAHFRYRAALWFKFLGSGHCTGLVCYQALP